MKRIYILMLLFILQQSSLVGQPDITWVKSYGGSLQDYGRNICQTIDGGYIITATTASNDGDVTGNHGERDLWVIKLTSQGEMEWQKCYGGSDWESGAKVFLLNDSTYMVTGSAKSTDGDVIGNHGGWDIWLLKIDINGNILWQECYGGSGVEDIYDIDQTTDGGYIFAGYTTSEYIEGELTGNQGMEDYWIVKLDSLGVIQWHKLYGGSHTDVARSVLSIDTSGYFVLGSTGSSDGDISCSHGASDFFLLRLNMVGEIVWSKCFGGSDQEDAGSIIELNNSGWLLVGCTDSDDGDVTGNHGGNDVWILKIDYSGIIEWQKCFGGSLSDQAFYIQETLDGNYIITGNTASDDGDVTGLHGVQRDIWVFKMDDQHNIVWQRCIGGTRMDRGYHLVETEENIFTLLGYCYSFDGDLTFNHGRADICIFNLSETVSISEQEQIVNIFPNPTLYKGVNIELNLEEPVKIYILDLYGRIVLTKELYQNNTFLDLESIPNGLYFIHVYSDDKLVHQQKIIKNSL